MAGGYGWLFSNVGFDLIFDSQLAMCFVVVFNNCGREEEGFFQNVLNLEREFSDLSSVKLGGNPSLIRVTLVIVLANLLSTMTHKKK